MTTRISYPDVDYLRDILSYDLDTGEFTWLESRGSVAAGSKAGARSTSRGKTYIYIKIDKRLYQAHRLAWLMVHGQLPDSDIDHADGDSENNRFDNLRECSMSQNKANSKTYKNNKSGYKGVFRVGNKYRVSVQKDRKRVNLGRFDTPEEAAEAYELASRKMFGEFARSA